MKDLTKGKPSALILSFALPIFLGNLLQLTYSLVDTRIVGSFLGEDALAAVGATSTLSGLIIGFLLGLSNGFAIITAQKFGAKNIADMKKSFAMSLVIGTGISILFTIAGLLFLKPILHFLNVPKHLVPVAKGYIAIIIAGLLATFLYDACAATLRAIGDAVTPLIILAISVALNIVGDLFFVVVLKTGVKGAAIATVLAQIIAFVICWIYMIRKYEILRLQKEDFKDPSPIMVKEMISAGMSMGFMSSLVNIGTLTLQTAINKLGKDIIIAHTAARKITEIFMIMFSVFGQTMATYCGQNYGAGKYDRIRQGLKAVLGIGCVFSVIIFILSHTISPYLISFIASSKNKEVIYWGTQYLVYDMSFQVVCVFIVILRNSLQGIGDQRTPVFSSFIELAGKVVFTLVFVRRFGYWAVIWTEPVIWICMVIPLIVTAAGNPVLFGKQK